MNTPFARPAQLDLHGAAYRYPSLRGARARVLSDVTWHAGRGVSGIIGPNGSGKSTLLTLCAQLARPTSGSVQVRTADGVSLTRKEVFAQSILAFVPQRYSFTDSLTVGDTLRYMGWIHKMQASVVEDRLAEMTAKVGLHGLEEHRAGELSGGQRQKLAIACGLVSDPQILILDEPTVGLDPAARIDIREILHQLGRTRTVVLTTHLIEDLKYIADSVAILVGGSLRYAGSFDDFVRHVPEGRASRFGDTFENAYRALTTDAPIRRAQAR